MKMSELIARHNELADKLGVSHETSFKSSAAAKAAISTLETRLDKTMTADTTDAPFDGANPITDTPVVGDKTKYNSAGKRGPNQGVGAFAKDLIAQGKTNAEVLVAVQAQFPQAKTTTGCIAFYRTALKSGTSAPKVKSSTSLREKAEALLAKADEIDAAVAVETETA